MRFQDENDLDSNFSGDAYFLKGLVRLKKTMEPELVKHIFLKLDKDLEHRGQAFQQSKTDVVTKVEYLDSHIVITMSEGNEIWLTYNLKKYKIVKPGDAHKEKKDEDN